MNPRAPLIWLFDVDGTLITTRGAAREVFARALRDLFGIDDDLADIPFAGRTDPLLLDDIARKHRLALDAHDEARFWEYVMAGMRAALGAGRGRLLPGVAGLIGRVERTPGWVPALLTGNLTQTTQVKLRHFGIYERFALGAFGEDAPERNGIARVAVARAQARYGSPPARCIVIGDTEHDVACARAAGAHAVAVTTGGGRREVLEASAPDLLLDDLGDPRLIAWAEALDA